MQEIKEELLDLDVIKKSNKPLLDLFIRRTAVITSTPEHLVEKAVKDQWSRANKVTQPSSSIGEIDFCNLGTFYMSKPKAKKRISKIERIMDLLIKKEEEGRSKYSQETKERMRLKNLDTIRSIKIKTKQNEVQC